MVKRCCCQICLIITLLIASSCKRDDVYLYDKTGFVPGREPMNSYNRPPFQNQQYYDPRFQPAPRNFGYQPNSRSYSNPYDFPSQQNFYPYYDSERYYVPPNYYRNVEPDYNSSVDMKY